MTAFSGFDIVTVFVLLVAAGFVAAMHVRRNAVLRRAADRLSKVAGGGARPITPPSITKYIESCVDQACDRLALLEHRTIQRHPVTGLKTREVLLARLGSPSAASGVLGIITLADFDALAAFDADAADQVLQSLAQRLVRMTPGERLLAQVDRACFAIWFEATAVENAVRELEALCYALRGRLQAPGVEFLPQIRYGHVVVNAPVIKGAALLAQALAAAHGERADASGDRFVASADAFSLEQDLRQAVERHQFELWYQPVVDARAGSVCSVEALIRWHHPLRGPVPPGHFIPVMESIGLSEEVGNWVLDRAARDAAAWTRLGLDQLKVAVNVSAHQLVRTDLDAVIERIIARHGLPPAMLELELTETAAAVDSAAARTLFARLRAHGIAISIDDFGAGYSSLSYLKRLEFDKLKIDREFVSHVDTDRQAQAICQSIITLAQGLGLTVLGEGVERYEEYAWLRHHGCHLFQGYYFSEPLPYDDLLKFAASPATIVEKCVLAVMPRSRSLGVLAA